ncbi:unnamed protein product [Mytilus coruscus]|uniref:Uncharacterized protein n=1 Tax=Mytilus coruscus TaxID=42192 RepID=A0A6J8AB46_MYTCO|nr:unnamed protein product [Mytilus coruscus]
MWTPNDIGMLPNEDRSDEERLLHVEGNMWSNGINVLHAERIQVANANVDQSEQVQRQTTLCGVGWDIKHTILVILVISSIIIMITTFSVVLSKCSQETYCNATISNNTHHISNCAEYSKVHEYNTLRPEPGYHSMGRKDKKSSKQANSKDTSDNLINDEKTTGKINETLVDISEILNDTNHLNILKEKQPCFFWTCVCLCVIIVVSLVIIISYLVKCDAKENNCNATISNNTHHISNCAEYSKVQEYNTLHPEPFCQFPFPRSQVSFMKCFLPFKGEYTLNCVLTKRRSETHLLLK